MRIFSKIYIVSHSRERSEKTCLNCNAQIYGRFCHVCGQENTDPRESIWSIISHFFSDITHFDGKFFKTTGKLLVKPGYLPSEYIKGRRAKYLHPIRMYVFTSAIFFIIFYSTSSPEFDPAKTGDSNFSIGMNNNFRVDPLDTLIILNNRERPYKTLAEYDSVQKTLAQDKRDNWITRKITQRNIERNNKYAGRTDMIKSSMINNFLHSFPYLLFVSLPLSALFLQLLYFRNKNNIYAGHTIFLIYLYVFTFLAMLAFFGLESLKSKFHSGWIGFAEFALFTYLGIYTLVAMKKYYAEGWGFTIFKFIVFNILAFISILILFVVFLLLSLLIV